MEKTLRNFESVLTENQDWLKHLQKASSAITHLVILPFYVCEKGEDFLEVSENTAH